MTDNAVNQSPADNLLHPADKTVAATKTQKLVALGVLVVVVVGLLGFFGWNYFIKVHNKIISGINYYNSTVTVSANGQTKTLQPFDTYEFVLNTDQPVTVEVKDAEGKLLLSRTHAVTRKSGVAIDILADESDGYAYCYVDADVRGSFYENSGDKVKNLNVLNKEAKSGYYYEFGQFAQLDDYYLVPTRYNGDALPDKLSSDTAVRGLYPVECNNVDDQEKLKDDIASWSNYDPATLRDYLKQLEDGLLNGE